MKRFLFQLLILIFLAGMAGPVRGGDVAVIKSSGAGVYKESLEGFRQIIRHRVVAEYDMKGDFERGRKALEKLQSTVNPNLLFTLGTPALQVASRKKTSLPAVYSMVFNPNSIIGTEVKNITGVSMNVSVKETIQLLKELSPSIRRVGVVFNPAKSGNLVIQALPVARKQGIQLVTRQIRSASKAIPAVNSLRGKIDVLWIVPDETILPDEVFQHMLLFSYKNKVPILGLSEKQTEMGALLALSYRSNKDMGRQAGDMANRILSGIKAAKIHNTTSRQVKLNVNLRAARKLKVEVPDSLVAKADNAVQAPVYEEGDWWVYRVKRGNESPEEYRITYKNGEFQGDDPLFLAELSPPLASVHLKHPQIKNFNFPLMPGRIWKIRYSQESYGIAPHSELLGYTGAGSVRDRWKIAEVEVTGPIPEIVETPAGEFRVIEIRRSEILPLVEMVYYYSPESKSVVKLTVDLPDARAVGEAIDHIEMELIKYGHQVPSNFSKAITDLSIPDHKEMNMIKLGQQASNVKAPVYVDGDWWVFRVKIDEKAPEEYRITYKDGEFQGDDPLILTDPPPLASVYSNHPVIKNFNFPLIPGKKWSYRYSRDEYGWPVNSHRREGTPNAEVQVTGPLAEPVETTAGTFEVVEIRRISFSTGGKGGASPTVETVYYYSPATKSVVKLSAKLSKVVTDWTIPDQIEMELIKYGSGVKLVEQPIVKAPVIEGNQ